MRKTGIVVFSSRIASVFTGLVFLVMITKTLSASQFGLWEVIIDLVTFASYPAGLVTFWATRDIARGSWVGKTAISMNMMLSAGGVLLYLLFSIFTSAAVKVGIEPLLLAIVLIPLSYWSQAANAIVTGHNPAVLGYAVIASELSKIAVAAPLLLVFRTGIEGVIASMMVAYLAQAAVSSYMTSDASSNAVNMGLGSRWLAKTWLPVIINLPYVIGIADTFVASLASNGTDITGYYQAAFSTASIAGYSIYLASALYPLLLRGGSDELMSTTLDLALLFSIPMAFGAAVLAQPILFFLKPQYVVGSTALGIMAFAAVFVSVSGILDQALLGRERVDAEETADLRRYLASDLVFVPVVNIAYSVVYVAAIYVTVSFGVASGMPMRQIIDYWAVIQLLTTVAFVAVKVVRVRKKASVVLHRSLVWYIVSSAVMSAAAYLLAGTIINYRSTTLVFGLQLALVSIAAMLVYALVLLALDAKFRQLVSLILKVLGVAGRG